MCGSPRSISDMSAQFLDPSARARRFPGLDNVIFWLRTPTQEQWVTNDPINAQALRLAGDILNSSVNLSGMLASATAFCAPPTFVHDSLTFTATSPTLEII